MRTIERTKMRVPLICMLSINISVASAQNFQNATHNKRKVVTVAKVKSPWYAFPLVLRLGFKKAVPEYQNKDGLEFKYFAMSEHAKLFGGIYLWENLEKAQKQFSELWFSRVKSKYKTDGKVEYYELMNEKVYVKPEFEYQRIAKHCVTLFIHEIGLETCEQYTKEHPALLRSYVVRESANYGSILLFSNQNAASGFIHDNTLSNFELFVTPVLVNNRQ